MHVIIAGAGIAGLTVSLALAEKGWRVSLVERTEQLSEVGAGLQLGANAVRILSELGLAEPLMAAGFAPQAAEVRVAATGKLLLRNPLGAEAQARWGAPYLQISRTDLQFILLNAAKDHPQINLRLGAEVVSVEPDGSTATAILADGERIEGDLVIGADGVRSRLRNALFGSQPLQFTGQVAWRGLVPAERFSPGLIPPVAAVWTAPAKHFVHYYVCGGRMVNFVGVVERDWREESWTEPGDPAELQADFAGWPEPVRAICAAVEQPFRWALYGRPPMPRWSRGRATLMGDACHPMLPFLAQGAAMAIEDAAVLALELEQNTDVPGALQAYEQTRLPRATKVQSWSRRNARLFHLPQPASEALFGAAALADRFVPGGAAARFDWLYGYRTT
jgi:salicylate hydroxylase